MLAALVMILFCSFSLSHRLLINTKNCEREVALGSQIKTESENSLNVIESTILAISTNSTRDSIRSRHSHGLTNRCS